MLRHLLAFLLHGVPQTPKAPGSTATLVLVAERAAIDTVADSLQSNVPVMRDAHIFGPPLIRRACYLNAAVAAAACTAGSAGAYNGLRGWPAQLPVHGLLCAGCATGRASPPATPRPCSSAAQC